MLNRDYILKQAVHNCYRELFRKAQPRGNYDKYVRQIEAGELPKNTKIYERHYLPEKELKYIVEKYKKAYRIVDEWRNSCDYILTCLEKGGLIDEWDYKSNCEGVKHTKPLKDLIGSESAKIVLNLIKGFKDFYRCDREVSSFDFTIYLGCSPTSNAETVINYWKSQGVDIKIDKKENLTEDDYWEIDYYGHICNDK